MQIRLLAFSYLQRQLGFAEQTVDCLESETPRALLHRLAPDLDLSGVRVALDEEYADWDAPLGTAQELELIPPVSGG